MTEISIICLSWANILVSLIKLKEVIVLVENDIMGPRNIVVEMTNKIF